jgi:hypothetical protein
VVPVVEGRRPPHHAARGRAVTGGAEETLRQAEILVRVVCDVAVAGAVPDERALARMAGTRWWPEGVRREAVVGTVDRLRDAARAWAATPPGGALRWSAAL